MGYYFLTRVGDFYLAVRANLLRAQRVGFVAQNFKTFTFLSRLLFSTFQLLRSRVRVRAHARIPPKFVQLAVTRHRRTYGEVYTVVFQRAANLKPGDSKIL